MRTVAAIVLAVALVTAAPAEAVTKKQLRAQVTRWQVKAQTWKQRAGTYREQRDQARAAVTGDLAARVSVVAQAGRISDLHALIFEPIRTAWPCGATLYQGESFWSLDVDTWDYDDDLNRIDCSA